jgi:RNA recognition motif-containing protein
MRKCGVDLESFSIPTAGNFVDGYMCIWKLVLENVRVLNKKIYVGNLSYDSTEPQVRELFEQHGKVESVAWITDRDTGRFRGFAFVEMEESHANAAIKSLNSQLIDGRELRVNEARPQTDKRRNDRSGGGNRNRGGYNSGW